MTISQKPCCACECHVSGMEVCRYCCVRAAKDSAFETMMKQNETVLKLQAEKDVLVLQISELREALSMSRGTVEGLEAGIEEAGHKLENAERDLATANRLNGELRNALSYYSVETAWRDTADNYGQVWVFDWPGDLGDNPWDIAKVALAEKRDVIPQNMPPVGCDHEWKLYDSKSRDDTRMICKDCGFIRG